MHFIKHIIEPSKLLLAWQSLNEEHRTRYIVAELIRDREEIYLRYLVNTKNFKTAQNMGFECYPAFPDISKTYNNVIDTFMRRLPPRTRGDFSKYLEGFRLKPDMVLSDFALLGYTGAKLPSDAFSIINPFENVDETFELLLEVTDFRIMENENNEAIKLNAPVSFSVKFNNFRQENEIHIILEGKYIGYVNRGLIPTFLIWLDNKRVLNAWIEKMNGMPGKPTAYLFVKVSPVSK